MLADEAVKGQLKVSTPAEYIAKLEEPRKTEVVALDGLIRKTAPKLAPFIHGGMLAYGPWHYKYAGDEKGYVAERYKGALPKTNIGRSCVRFKRLSDLDLAPLKKMIRDGARQSAKA